MIALSGAIFHLKAQIVFKLQDLAYQTPDLIAWRKSLVEDLAAKVQELNRDNFAVKQHLKYVDLYSNPDHYNALTYEDTLLMGQELAPLIEPDADDAKALRFDALMYGIELAYLAGKKYSRARHDLIKKVAAVASVANIPEIMMQAELIDKILNTDYLDNAGINEFEHIRENLRDLMKYIPKSGVIYDTDFDDEVLSTEWHMSEPESEYLINYKAKAEYYVRQHQDNAVIAKLKGNVPLTEADVKVLESILWSEVGTKQDYEREIGSIPLGEFVRSVVGLDMAAAKAAFAESERSWTPAEWAFRWLYNQPEVTVVLSGMNSLQMVEENCRTADDMKAGSLTDKDFELLEKVKRAIHEKERVGCTGCRYCMPCPKGVDIPGTFACWNTMYTEGKSSGRFQYAQTVGLTKEPAFATQCIECGKCEQHCPQSIPIRQKLKEADKDLRPFGYKVGINVARKFMFKKKKSK